MKIWFRRHQREWSANKFKIFFGYLAKYENFRMKPQATAGEPGKSNKSSCVLHGTSFGKSSHEMIKCPILKLKQKKQEGIFWTQSYLGKVSFGPQYFRSLRLSRQCCSSWDHKKKKEGATKSFFLLSLAFCVAKKVNAWKSDYEEKCGQVFCSFQNVDVFFKAADFLF